MSSSASSGRSSSVILPAGDTSTPTSGSGTASIRSGSAQKLTARPTNSRRGPTRTRFGPPSRRRPSSPRARSRRSHSVHRRFTRREPVVGAGWQSWPAMKDQAPGYAGRLEIPPAGHAPLGGGGPPMLSVRELQLLAELAHNPERVMTREELYGRVWGRSYRRSDRSVDVYVGRLRAKLDRALPGRRFIHTHTGVGYRFSPQT